MQKLNPYYHNKLGVGLYVWRDLSLSQMNKGEKIVGWNLCHSGSEKCLKTGEEAKFFHSVWEANEYLKKNYKLKVYGYE